MHGVYVPMYPIITRRARTPSTVAGTPAEGSVTSCIAAACQPLTCFGTTRHYAGCQPPGEPAGCFPAFFRRPRRTVRRLCSPPDQTRGNKTRCTLFHCWPPDFRGKRRVVQAGNTDNMYIPNLAYVCRTTENKRERSPGPIQDPLFSSRSCGGYVEGS